MRNKNWYLTGAVLMGLTLGSFQAASAASLSVYLSAPGTESTFVGGASTETFNTLPLGNQTTPYVGAVGTYQFSPSSPMAAVAADAYGGANNTQYISLGTQSGTSAPVTIQLNQASNYFGFWFSAGDSNNGISFYSGGVNGTLLARYSTADILTLLSNPTITAVDASTYSSSTYFGNPTAGPYHGLNSSQPYSYVDIVASGTTFDTIVLDNSGTTGTGFESDNHSIYTGTVSIPGGDVLVTNLTVVPEPSQYVALMGALIFCLVMGQRMLKQFRSSQQLVPIEA